MEQDKEDNKEIAEIKDAIPANVNDILQELPEAQAADFGMPSSNC